MIRGFPFKGNISDHTCVATCSEQENCQIDDLFTPQFQDLDSSSDSETLDKESRLSAE